MCTEMLEKVKSKEFFELCETLRRYVPPAGSETSFLHQPVSHGVTSRVLTSRDVTKLAQMSRDLTRLAQLNRDITITGPDEPRHHLQLPFHAARCRSGSDVCTPG